MNITSSGRVIYQNNPLAEVVFQIRFDQVERLESGPSEEFVAELALLDYVVPGDEATYEVTFDMSAGHPSENVGRRHIQIFHFTTSDNVWRVSLCSEFIAITCIRYPHWEGFREKILAVVERFSEFYSDISAIRVGLRYKDLIEREPLGLADRPWHELIAPFLLGPLFPGALIEGEGVRESDVVAMLSQSIIRLDECMLQLQSSLLTSGQNSAQRAFLIDADFFVENEMVSAVVSSRASLEIVLAALHLNAGSLFRRGITQELHNALCAK